MPLSASVRHHARHGQQTPAQPHAGREQHAAHHHDPPKQQARLPESLGVGRASSGRDRMGVSQMRDHARKPR